MSKATYPPKLPASAKEAAARLACEDRVSLNQCIAAAVAEKVGAVETAASVLLKQSANATDAGLRSFLNRVPDVAPEPGDELELK